MVKFDEETKRSLSISKGKQMSGHFTAKSSIGQLLVEAAARRDRGITFIENDESETFVSYDELLRAAKKRLSGLQRKGVRRGDSVMLILEDNQEFLRTFWACVLGGIVPAPLSYPQSFTAKSTAIEKIKSIWTVLGKPLILSDSRAVTSPINDLLGTNMEIIEANLLDGESIGEEFQSAPEDAAFIQFSSGSTSIPKGVLLTHKNLLSNIDSIVDAAQFTDMDRSLSWMPYHHDMGLIGFHISMMAMQIQQFNMSPMKFVKKPILWLELVTKHKITLTGCPNFGYRLLLARGKEEKLRKLDLRSLRLIFNGAEPIAVSVMDAFIKKLEPYGLQKSAMFPVYGMAEACVAACFPPCGSEPMVRSVSRQTLGFSETIQEVDAKQSDSLLLADEGFPIHGLDVRIVGESGEVVFEKTIGEIQLRGPNITNGYVNNEEANRNAFQDGWFRTGDTGFIQEGRLTVIGRIKDIIFCNGQNYYAHDIETKIEELEGVKPGKVAVCGWHDPQEGTEKVAIFSTLRIKQAEQKPFYQKMLAHVQETTGLPVDYVVTIHSIPKTTSGKIQRFELIEAFKNETLKEQIWTAQQLNSWSPLKEEKGDISLEVKTMRTLKKSWADVLNLPEDQIPEETSFLSLGGSSLKAMQVLGMLEEELGISLTHDMLIQCRTVAEMYQYLFDFIYRETGNDEVAAAIEVEPPQSDEQQLAEDEIAVISMACRFPDASSPEDFWTNLLEKKNSINDVPRERFGANSLFHSNAELENKYAPQGAFLDNPFDFDAAAFGISEEEALVMDPQQRMMLELVYEVLERAAYSKEAVSGQKVGLYIGAGVNAYYEHHLNAINQKRFQQFNSFTALSAEQQESMLNEWACSFGEIGEHPNTLVDNILNMIAARSSQTFNFKGPSMVIDTACSSSLVTVHMACEAIVKGEAKMAIAGGINLLLTATPYRLFNQAGALSQNGTSSVFDREADGFVPGEGAGVVLLKPVREAIKDGDQILAVIKSSSLNNDGHSIGVMAPNPDGQREVVQSAYESSQITPNTIQYMESHGTGTRIGDPSEVRALDRAFQQYNVKPQSIALGSVKANIGHLLGSAGIASFIKVVMSLQNKKIAPQINIQDENPMLRLNETPFYLLKEPKVWLKADGPRRAAINSFGFGGTNCHFILEEAPEQTALLASKEVELPIHSICLSAHTETALIQKARRLSAYLESYHPDLGDVALTENTKSYWDYRASFSSRSIGELKDKLAIFAEQALASKCDKQNIVFLFTGQGSQYVGMGRQLYQHIPIFKKHLDECAQVFAPVMEKSLIALLFDEQTTSDELARTDMTQPVVFAIDYALGRLLLDLGARPTCLIGHSVGEWAAACLAGVVSLKDAAKFVALRGKLMNELQSSGAMAAVFVSKERMEELLAPFNDSVWIAGYNVTHQAISGSEEALQSFFEVLKDKGVAYKKLNVSQAFHTPLMEPMLAEFKRELEKVTFSNPRIPIISNITARFVEEPMDANYWIKHITSSVKFDQSIHYALIKGSNLFVEAGPDYVLAAMTSAVKLNGEKPTVYSLMSKKKPELDVFTHTLGSLFEKGVAVKWSKLYKGLSYKPIDLPLYPFERSTFAPHFGSGSTNQTHGWLYDWKWTEDKGVEASDPSKGSVLLFVHEGSWSESIYRQLVEYTDQPIFQIRLGEQFDRNGPYEMTVNPFQLTGIDTFKNALPTSFDSIVYVSKDTMIKQDKSKPESWEAFLALTSLVLNHCSDPIRLLLVTHQAFALTGVEKVHNPQQMMEATFAHVLDMETENLHASVLDLEEGEWGSAIANELKVKPHEEGIAVIRNGTRYVRTLKKKESVALSQNTEIAENDTYLFTGGAGSIGGEIALGLAAKARINLVLTGLSPLSEEEGDAKRQLIYQLESLGANVTYFAVDVGNRQEMQTLIMEVKNQYGTIQGIIHGAGLLSPNTATPLLERETKNLAEVMKPKVNGTLILDQLTRKEPLKFFVMLSSISASKKAWAAGLGDYAAANAFLDSFSYYRKADNDAPGKTISINYSLWEKEGIARSVHMLSTYITKTQGLESIPSTTGQKLFIQALEFEDGPVIHILKERTKERRQGPNRRERPNEVARVIPVKPKRRFSKAETHELVYQITAAQIKLPVEELETNRNFEELGIDSIRAVTVIDQIAHEMQVALNPTLLFEYQTPYDLAKHLEEQDEEARFLQEEVALKEQGPEEGQTDSDIAIIGIGLRFPGASTPEGYWDLLKSGKSVIQETPKERWSDEDHVSLDRNSLHSSYVNRGGFIERPYDFDPFFFGMSPSEAEATDPQQRLFLEVAWEAMQQAGYGSLERPTNVGVYVGCEQNTYMEHFIGYRSFKVLQQNLANQPVFSSMNETNQQQLMETISRVLAPGKLVPDAVAGNGLNEVAARVSHLFNLTGPSMVINTACSSSLVAVHQACEGLRSGQMEMALVGGVNLNLSPTPFASLSRVSALSPKGECRPFDKDADGMVLSEGCSAILLKPVSQAKRDKDHIYAVIKGSAVNNDGRSQGITAPRPQGQAEAIRSAYKSSGINPETVSYIEAHGTGTPLGDPIEIEGLTQAFQSFTTKTGFCGIGSVKSTIGHMLAASGLSSLIKVALSMKHQRLPHTLNFTHANPNIHFEDTPFYVMDKQSKSWKATGDTPLRAGVNAFGFGGTNAHIVLEEAPPVPEQVRGEGEVEGPQLLVVNARNEFTLKKVAVGLAHFTNDAKASFSDICYSMNTGQRALSYKAAVVIQSKQHLNKVLRQLELGQETEEILLGKSNPNRQALIQLVLTGEPQMNEVEIKHISRRFPLFEEDYRFCIDAATETMSEPIFQQWRAVAVEYALCCQLQRIGLEVEALHVSGNGLLTGLLLKNNAAIDRVFAMFCHKRLHTSSVNLSLIDGQGGWRAPLLSTLGDVQTLTVQQLLLVMDASFNRAMFSEKEHWFSFIGEGSGSFARGLSKEWSLKTLLTLVGALIVMGAKLQLSKVAGEEVGHLPLPTYPFERSTYRISLLNERFKELSQDDNKMKENISPETLRSKGNQTRTVEELNQELQLLSGSMYVNE